jgi:hypothetical protein
LIRDKAKLKRVRAVMREVRLDAMVLRIPRTSLNCDRSHIHRNDWTPWPLGALGAPSRPWNRSWNA